MYRTPTSNPMERMRTLIRRDRNLTWAQQMEMRRADAIASQTHPNGIANTERHKAESRYARDTEEALKFESRQLRHARRMAKKEALRKAGH